MSSVAATVKNKIFDKISTLSTIQVVSKHEEVNPSGFPAVSIVGTSQDGSFWTNASNQRVYAYRVFVHFPVGQNLPDVSGDRMDNAEDVVTDVVDQIIRVIDDNYTLEDDLGATILYVEAVDSDYQYTELESGWCKTAICTIKVHVEYILVPGTP